MRGSGGRKGLQLPLHRRRKPVGTAPRGGAHARGDGAREPRDREKLERAMGIALRKRPVEAGRVELVINSIIRRLESSGETEVNSDTIGEMVMYALSTLDQVAYVRFASVYRNFREASDFGDFIGNLGVVEGGE